MRVSSPIRTHTPRVIATLLCLLLLQGSIAMLFTGGVTTLQTKWSWFPLGKLLSFQWSRNPLVIALSAVGCLQQARSCVNSEREAINAEHDAFLDFADRVSELPTVTQPSVNTPGAMLIKTDSPSNRLQTVQQYYRDTVMESPDHAEEYGETLRESMAAEFSNELSTMVLEGEQFNPHLKQLFVNHARMAAQKRHSLLEALEYECESLATAESRLERDELPITETTTLELLEKPFGRLIELENRYSDSERRYKQLLKARQEEIQREMQWFPGSQSTHFQEYLYRDLDVTFPVLYTTLDRIRTLRENRRSVTRVIARRD